MTFTTHVENLKRGDHIAVTACKAPPPSGYGDSPPLQDFNGQPLKVLEVSLPFVAALWRGKAQSIDVRAWDFVKVSRKYADAMLSSRRGRGVAVGQQSSASAPDPRACPRCGERVVQRMVESKRRHSDLVVREWRVVCLECGWDGGEAVSV